METTKEKTAKTIEAVYIYIYIYIRIFTKELLDSLERELQFK